MNNTINYKTDEFQKYLDQLTSVQRKIVAIEMYPNHVLQEKHENLIALRNALTIELFYLTDKYVFSDN